MTSRVRVASDYFAVSIRRIPGHEGYDYVIERIEGDAPACFIVTDSSDAEIQRLPIKPGNLLAGNLNRRSRIPVPPVRFCAPALPQDLPALRAPTHGELDGPTISMKNLDAPLVFTGADQLHDDRGPAANYTYPGNSAFVPGILDIAGLTVTADESFVYFTVHMRALTQPGWHPEYGFQLTMLAIAIDPTDAGDLFVQKIKPFVKATFRPEVLTDIGGFGGLFSIAAAKDMDDPVLVSGTDGVGTKLKVAFAADRHDTIGIDLVAMCVNDVAVVGAEPLFFLDYYATGKLRAEQGVEVVRGIAEGCRQAGCALVGGETAELPGFYAKGEYDLVPRPPAVPSGARRSSPSSAPERPPRDSWGDFWPRRSRRSPSLRSSTARGSGPRPSPASSR